VLQYGPIFSKFHDKRNSFRAPFMVPRSIAPFELYYIFTNSQLSQEIDFVDNHGNLLRPKISIIKFICLDSITYYNRWIHVLNFLRSFLYYFFGINHCIWCCFYHITSSIWLISHLFRWNRRPRFIKVYVSLRTAPNSFYVPILSINFWIFH